MNRTQRRPHIVGETVGEGLQLRDRFAQLVCPFGHPFFQLGIRVLQRLFSAFALGDIHRHPDEAALAFVFTQRDSAVQPNDPPIAGNHPKLHHRAARRQWLPGRRVGGPFLPITLAPGWFPAGGPSGQFGQRIGHEIPILNIDMVPPKPCFAPGLNRVPKDALGRAAHIGDLLGGRIGLPKYPLGGIDQRLEIVLRPNQGLLHRAAMGNVHHHRLEEIDAMIAHRRRSDYFYWNRFALCVAQDQVRADGERSGFGLMQVVEKNRDFFLHDKVDEGPLDAPGRFGAKHGAQPPVGFVDQPHFVERNSADRRALEHLPIIRQQAAALFLILEVSLQT